MDDSSGRAELPDTWAEAANEAEFEFFEVEEPSPSHRWAGGYGYSQDGPVSLEVLARVDDTEVSVATMSAGNGLPDHVRRSTLLQDLLAHAARAFDPDRDPIIDLPHTVTFDAEDRTIVVDGEPIAFSGYATSEGTWVGIADIEDGRQVLVRALGPMPALRLGRCSNRAMPDSGSPLR